MSPSRALPRGLSALALVVLVTLVAGCNVLFVPRKPDATPTVTLDPIVHQFPALEARLPDEIAGTILDKVSVHSDPELQTAKTREVLRRLSKTPDDLQLARASKTGLNLTIAALRIVGADAIAAAVALESVDESDPVTPSTYQAAVIVGKRVLIRTTGTDVSYIYPLDDILFVVSGDRPLIEEALTKIR